MNTLRFLLILPLFVCLSAYGQGFPGDGPDTPPGNNSETEEVEPPKLVNVSLVQPEVWQMARPIEPGVDAYGDLNLSLPIMSVPGRGLGFDITFTYRSGITTDQPATWIGLGWSFDPGSVTREPEGALPEGMYGVDVFDIPSATYGPRQPDQYYATLPGQGTVQFSQSNKEGFTTGTVPNYTGPDVNAGEAGSFVPYEHRPWHIVADGNNIPNGYIQDLGTVRPGYKTVEASSFVEKEDFRQFVITTEDGTRYIFEAPSLSLYATVSGTGVIRESVFVDQYYVSTWRLVAILASDYPSTQPLIPDVSQSTIPNGRWVVFQYSDILEAVDDVAGGGGSGLNQITQNRYLEKVITPTHYADFTVSSTHGPARLSSDYRNTGGTDIFRKLDRIDLYRGWVNEATPYLLQSVTLTTNENEFSPYVDVALGSCSTGGGSLQGCIGRLRLDAIDFLGEDGSSLPGYSFKYGYNPVARIDDENVFHQNCRDDFGYHTFTYTENGACDPQSQDQYPEIGKSSAPDAHGSDAWSLIEIHHPSGAWEQFDYQADEVYDTYLDAQSYHIYDPYAAEMVEGRLRFLAEAIMDPTATTPLLNYLRQGGVRVMKTTRHDGMGGVIETEYDYGFGGMLTGVPVGHWKRVVYETDTPRSLFLPGNRGKIAVQYPFVTRINTLDGSRETQTYAIPLDEEALCVQLLSVDSQTISSVVTDNRNWRAGKLQAISQHDDNLLSISKVTHQLDFDVDEYSSLINWSVSGDSCPYENITSTNGILGCSSGWVAKTIDAREVQFARHHINNTTVEDRVAGNFIYTYTEYMYDEATNQVNKVTTSSQDNTRAIETRYAYQQYPFIENDPAIETDDVPQMEGHNMLSQVYSVKALDGSGNLLAKHWTEYTDDSGYWRPSSLWQWKGGADLDIPDSNIAVKLASIDQDDYDMHGNVLGVTDAKNRYTGYSWGHNGSLPTAISRLPGTTDELTTVAIYDDDTWRMRSLIGENGVQMDFKYDPFGRLIQTLAHNHPTDPDNETDDVLLAQYIYTDKGSNISATDPNATETILYTGTGDPMQSISYFDGLARGIQVQQKVENGAISTAIEYDGRSRESISWIPYHIGTYAYDAAFSSSAKSYHENVQGTGAGSIPNPYIKTNYKPNDPLSRVESVEYEGF